MKFKLVESIDRRLIEQILDEEVLEEATPQYNVNRRLRKKYLSDEDFKRYQVHHLDGTIIDDVKKLRNNDLNNVIFIKKGLGNKLDDIHRLIHLIAKCGGIDKLNSLITALDKPSDNFYRVINPETKELEALGISEVAALTKEDLIDI